MRVRATQTVVEIMISKEKFGSIGWVLELLPSCDKLAIDTKNYHKKINNYFCLPQLHLDFLVVGRDDPLPFYFKIICLGNLTYKKTKISLAPIESYFTAMVFQNLHQAYFLEVGVMQILAYHAPLSTTCHVRCHVDFS
jgi:hypothetical protein